MYASTILNVDAKWMQIISILLETIGNLVAPSGAEIFAFYFTFYREFDDLEEKKPSVIDFPEAYTDADGNLYCTLCLRKWNRSQWIESPYLK